MGVEFAHALGEMGTNHLHSMFAINAFVKHRDVWKSSHASSSATQYYFKNVLLFLHMLLRNVQIEYEHLEAHHNHAIYDSGFYA